MSTTTTTPQPRVLPFLPGDRISPFHVRSTVNPKFRFDSVAGRWIVLGFVGSAADAPLRGHLDRAMSDPVFDDVTASLFVVTNDAADEATGRLADRIPGTRIFWDFDGVVARLCGALPADAPQQGEVQILRFWMLLDPALTVRKIIPFRPDGSDVAEMLDTLRRVPPPERFLGFEVPVPILVLPDVFEPEFCDHLIGLYEAAGGEISGFMRDEGGKTVAVHDPNFKVRRDYNISDPDLIRSVQTRILRRIVPQIERVHYFKCTRMERYLVACYDADEGGHFRPHRDNTTLGTAHRRFAVSINLNDDFEGGEVSFPEYSPRGFKAPRGGAVIFSCSMLHAVSRVTSGRRFAFLPFLYDDAAAALRERNARSVPNSAGYRA